MMKMFVLRAVPRICWRLLGIHFCVSGILYGQLNTTEKEDIGFTSLQTRLGGSMPTGSKISMSQVEGSYLTAGAYRTDTSEFASKSIVFPLATGTTSVHARIVGRYFYGPQSLSPDAGNAADSEEVISYELENWLYSGFLGTGTGFIGTETSDVQNHSWISYDDYPVATNEEILRRVDYSIIVDDYVATFGLNNGDTTDVPALMASAFNGIAVGRSDGDHSRGGTLIEGSGRVRPDIVVPTSVPVSATSWAAPTVGSAAALLIETSRGTSGLGDGERSEVVKSVLLTGATRDEPEFAGLWSNSTSVPLDEVYGAGELNIDRSHQILTGGDHSSGMTLVNSEGWSFESITHADGTKYYFIDLNDPGVPIYNLDVSLAWNRDVDNTLTPTLANLDLKVFQASGFMAGSLVGESISTVDNVELLALSGLSPGRYAIGVESSFVDPTEYGLSWIAVIPEFSSLILAGILLGALLGWGLIRPRG